MFPKQKSPDVPESDENRGEKTRVLTRSYEILMSINNHPDGLSLREICHYTKLPRSTVRRILETLEEQNMVMTAPSTNLYRLGPTLARFASNIRPFDIGEIARPIVMQLATRTEESVYSCVVAHGVAVVVDLIPGTQPLYMVAAMGSSLPLFATACGKALLATLSDLELEALRTQIKLVPFTKNTTTDWNKLLSEIESIRETGVALDREEYQMGICGIAVPLKGPGGELGTISIPMTTERYQAVGEQLTQILQEGTQSLRWSL